MNRKLPLMCPQEYDGVHMSAVACTHCDSGWNKKTKRCDIEIGCENMPVEKDIPDCPMQHVCQHQLQSNEAPCPVRARGMICESALIWSGLSEAEASEHPLSFNYYMM